MPVSPFITDSILFLICRSKRLDGGGRCRLDGTCIPTRPSASP